MVKVAFVFFLFDSRWMGGLNYYRSLARAVANQKVKRIDLVIVVPPHLEDRARELFPKQEIITTTILKKYYPLNILRKIALLVMKSELVLDRFLAKKGIEVLSHGITLGHSARTKTIAWIPDFQHHHLSHFFSFEEIQDRNSSDRRAAQACTRLIVSSETAAKDALAQFPEIEKKLKVLHFSPDIGDAAIVSKEELSALYGIKDKYIFLPNQFWAHKNHLTVIEAIAILKGQGIDITVVCTGSKDDIRNAFHYQAVKSAVEEGNVEGNFIILGLVPYSHMISLMFHSHALINPSLFEGWSTTVEEAKIFDKQLILSDLSIHREQAGEAAAYFSALSPQECAQALVKVWTDPRKPGALDFLERALEGSQAFGETYAQIVLDSVRDA